MKTRLAVLAALIGLAAPSHAYNGWGLFGTYWKASDAGSDAGAGGRISIEMVPEVQLELRASYYGDMGDEGAGDAKIEVVPLEAGLMLRQHYKGKLGFIGGGGVGYYQADLTRRGPLRATSSENEIGFWLALGAEYKIKKNASLFAEAKYTFVSIDQGGVGLPDADLDGPGANVGLLIRW